MLDQATHQHSETVTAWSLFVTMLFSSIRDGYYNALREQRNSIRKKSLRQTNSNANQTRRVSEEVTTSASSTTPSPTGATLSSNNLMMEKIATARRDSRTSVNQLNVSNSRKSSVGSNAGGDSVSLFSINNNFIFSLFPFFPTTKREFCGTFKSMTKPSSLLTLRQYVFGKNSKCFALLQSILTNFEIGSTKISKNR